MLLLGPSLSCLPWVSAVGEVREGCWGFSLLCNVTFRILWGEGRGLRALPFKGRDRFVRHGLTLHGSILRITAAVTVTLIPQSRFWSSQWVLVGLFSVSGSCCVKKGNKYPGFIFILFFSREDRIASLRCPALSSLPRLILASFVTVLLKNKIEDATNIQCVSSELILFFYTQSCFFADFLHCRCAGAGFSIYDFCISVKMLTCSFWWKNIFDLP